MLKILTVLIAVSLTFASAKAFDNTASDNAAAAFGQYGLNGLAVVGRAPPGYGYPLPFGPHGYPPFGPTIGATVSTPVSPPVYVYSPVCWTRYVTVATGNTLVNFPQTICR